MSRENTWAIVTGASKGIGFIAARALASRGYNLIVGARGRRGLAQAARSLEALGARVVQVPVDLSSRPSLEAFLERALDASNGAISTAFLSFGNPACEPCTLKEATWQDWLEAASLYLASTHTILSRLAREARGPVRVIILSSFTVRSPHPPLAIADTVRAGLYGMVRLAAREWPGRLVPILLVMGSIRTPGAWKTVSTIAEAEGRDPEEYWKTHVEALTPLGRTATPQELEELVAFLARAPEYMAGGIVEFHAASTTSW